MALGVVFLQPRWVDELEKIQVERAANHRQMNLKQGEGSLFLQCLTPAGSPQMERTQEKREMRLH